MMARISAGDRTRTDGLGNVIAMLPDKIKRAKSNES
jgi:hypothetical protein